MKESVIFVWVCHVSIHLMVSSSGVSLQMTWFCSLRLCNTPLCIYTYFLYPFILWYAPKPIPQVTVVDCAAIKIGMKVALGHADFNSFRYMRRGGIVGLHDSSVFGFLRTCMPCKKYFPLIFNWLCKHPHMRTPPPHSFFSYQKECSFCFLSCYYCVFFNISKISDPVTFH